MRKQQHITFLDVDVESNLPYLIGGLVVVAIAAAIAAAVLSCRRKTGPAKPTAKSVAVRSEFNEFDHVDRVYGDQRTTVRREGGFVPVWISSPVFQDGLKSGVVLDRSLGGLRIASEVPVVPGSTIQIMAEVAPPDTPWVTVAVRNCIPESNRFVLGCEFETTPPWNVLLLFG